MPLKKLRVALVTATIVGSPLVLAAWTYGAHATANAWAIPARLAVPAHRDVATRSDVATPTTMVV